MNHHLTGMKVAALVEHGFEQSELLEPRKALEAAGARVDVISPVEGAVKGWQHGDLGRGSHSRSAARGRASRRLRRAAAAWWRLQSRSSAHERTCRAIRQGVRAGQSADRGDLPWAMDVDRGRRTTRPARDLVAVAQDRSEKRRRDLGRWRSDRRPRDHHVAKPGRHPGLQPEDDRSVRRFDEDASRPRVASATNRAGRRIR